MNSSLAKSVSPARLPLSVGAVFVVTFLLYRNGVLNHLYEYGAGTDIVNFAAVLWHGDWRFLSPETLDWRSFLGTHFMVLLIPVTLVSHLFPFDSASWYAIVLAVFHAFTTAVLAWICWRAASAHVRHPYQAEVIGAAAGLAYAVCALQAVFLWVPHPEIAIPGFLMATTAALALRRPIWAGVFFVCLLAMREDAGLHAFSFLAPLVVLTWWRERRWLAVETMLAMIALAYSLVIVKWVMPTFFTDGGYLLQLHYIGDPPYAHLSSVDVGARFELFFWQVGRAWVPLAVLVVAAALRRDPVIAVGTMAVTPWVLLHLLVVKHEAGWTLAHYYTFPLLVSVGWPALVSLYRTGPVKLAGSSRFLLVEMAVIAAAFTPPLGTTLPHGGSNYRGLSFTPTEASRHAESYGAFTRALEIARPELGRIGANVSFAALAPHLVSRREWIDSVAPGYELAPEAIDSILLLNSYYPCPDAGRFVRAADMRYRYHVPGTRIVMLTRRPIDEFPTFKPLVSPYPGLESGLC
jgi:hypothetical protein